MEAVILIIAVADIHYHSSAVEDVIIIIAVAVLFAAKS